MIDTGGDGGGGVSFLVHSGFLPYPPNNEAPRKLAKLDIEARVLTRTNRMRELA
jgi:hypothetical protein